MPVQLISYRTSLDHLVSPFYGFRSNVLFNVVNNHLRSGADNLRVQNALPKVPPIVIVCSLGGSFVRTDPLNFIKRHELH